MIRTKESRYSKGTGIDKILGRVPTIGTDGKLKTSLDPGDQLWVITEEGYKSQVRVDGLVGTEEGELERELERVRNNNG